MEWFTLKYDFGEKNKEVQDFIKILGKNSMTFLSSLIEEKKISSKDYRNENLATKYFVQCVEEYLYYYYIFNKDDFSNIFSEVSKLCAIAPIDSNLKGLYGITIPVSTGFTIQINPLMIRGEFLNSAERSRLYVAHELGHVINAMWMKKVAEKFSVKTSGLEFSQDAQKIMYDGFSMLDEAITQDRAEDIAYFFAKKKRPAIASYVDGRGLYNGKSYRSNFDFYSELQEPATIFARTLRGIGKIDDESGALNMLSKRAIRPDFVDAIFKEYKEDGQIDNLYRELANMGVIKNASYARFGCAPQSNLDMSVGALEKLKNIAFKMRDYRD